MKVGDFVGWENSWEDEKGCEIIGLIIREYRQKHDDGYSEYFDILESATGDILNQVPKEILVVIYESR
jgi:hypothetical protein